MPAETSKNVSENVATRVFAQQLAQEREHVAKIYARPVSYTHLTLPTICSV